MKRGTVLIQGKLSWIATWHINNTSLVRTSEQKVPLCQRQDRRRRALQQLAVGPDAVRVRVHLDLRRGVVPRQVLLAHRPTLLYRDHRPPEAVALRNLRSDRGLRDERQAAQRVGPAEGGELRP